MIKKERQILAQDQRLTVRLIAEELALARIRRTSSSAMICVKRKIWSRFVPHKFTDEQKAQRMEISEDSISMCDQEPLLLGNIVTRDETWYYQFDSESKLQSMAWCSPTFPRPKKSSAKIQGQTIDFFDNTGIIHTDFFPCRSNH